MPGVPNRCTGVAGRAEFEINVAGGNPVILDVMPQESDIIAELLRRKEADDLRADDMLFRGDNSPLLSSAITDAESQLGFALPDMLRRIYTHVANGGFGYAYGLLGLNGGMLNEDGNDATKQYLDYREPDANDLY